MNDSKTCVTCQVDKPLELFNRKSEAKDGRNSWCKECQHIYHKKWKAEHPEKVAKNTALYHQRHLEKRAENGKNWREKNKDHHRQLIKDWEKKNPERVAAKSKRYRERNPEQSQKWQDQRRDSGRRRLANMVRRGRVAEAEIPGHALTLEVLHGRFEVHGWRCYYCRMELDIKTVTADHRIPLLRGGKHCGSNIVPACNSCNVKKSKRTEREYLEHIHGRQKLQLHKAVDVSETVGRDLL